MSVELDRRNAEFWNELCGTTFAAERKLKGNSADALTEYDTEYLAFYPYLLGYVQPETMLGRTVLEIGLGYGTIGQRIAASGARYFGVDIADGPVRMMALRLRAMRSPLSPIRASGYALPFPSDSFDDVVSIGCLHHTGHLADCISEVYRVLRPGGRAVIMLYNQFSYRQWLRSPLRTVVAVVSEAVAPGKHHPANERQRRLYDVDTKGRAAPATVFVSAQAVRKLFRGFSTVEMRKENCDDVLPGGGRLALRRRLLRTLGRRAGLDIYVTARK